MASPHPYILGTEDHQSFTEKSSTKWKGKGDAVSLGFELMAKYALTWDIWKIQASFENGFGLGMYYHSFSFNWEDVDDDDNTINEGGDVLGMIFPCLDLTVKAKYKLDEASALGLGFGVNTIFMMGDGFELPIIMKIGLNYSVNY